MNKKKYIKNIIKQVLNEAMMDGFNYQELDNLPTYQEKSIYCEKMLGEPIGTGSSRVVYQLDDNMVLKFAINQIGVVQNKQEYVTFQKHSPILPKIFKADGKFLYVVSEYVLPITNQDFKHCLGVDFRYYQEFMKYAYNMYNQRGETLNTKINENIYKKLLTIPWFREVVKMASNYDLGIGDLIEPHNLGMTQRNGKPTIVILDSGLNVKTIQYLNKR